jgi:hypothetical protein
MLDKKVKTSLYISTSYMERLRRIQEITGSTLGAQIRILIARGLPAIEKTLLKE